MGFRFLLLLLLPVLIRQAAFGPTQTTSTIGYLVQPGDTWTALAQRFNMSSADLQTLSGHINTARQPAIGSTIQIPASINSERTGAIVRDNHGGLLQTAVIHGTPIWSLALANDLSSPYRPLLWQPIGVARDQILRELPIGAADLALTPDSPVPGEALAVHVEQETGGATAEVALDGLALAVTNLDQDVLAVGGTGAFTQPGEHELSIRLGSAPVWRQPWVVAEREWIFQELTLSGTAAEIDQAAIDTERARLSTIWSQVTPQAQWSAPFQLPIADYLEISAEYGARRSYNGGPYRSYHEGVDFSAYSGTSVTAAAPGTVVLAEPLYVRGGAVLIDHGLGIYTGYYHLSSILVEAGQSVQTGDQVGEVGTTGLSTGNHLHWDLIVNGNWVDAQRWQEQGTACWLLEKLGESCLAEG